MTINYREGWYENDKPNYAEFDKDSDFWQMTYFDRWHKFIELLPEEKILDMSILEIGCGMGRALSYFKGFGADVVGVEPSEHASKIAKEKGVPVINDYFENVTLKGYFDVVYIEQVLSHIPDHSAVLARSHKLLNPDGLIMVEEPNDYNAFQLDLKDKYGEYWKTPDHVNYFNFDSMRSSLKANGFDVVYESATYPMELFLCQGEDYINNATKGKEVHDIVKKTLLNMSDDNRTLLLEAFAAKGLGRDIVMIGKKRELNKWED